MKKTLLSTALCGLLTSTLYANDAPTPSPAPVVEQSSQTTTVTTSTTTPAVVNTIIDCHYRIPADTINIDQAILKTWAKNAALQSFTFKPDTLDQDINALKACYTDQGFIGFNDAMQKSGNLATIKGQQLTVSGTANGEVTIANIKDNQWRATVPVEVVYQSPKEKLAQDLTVDLLIGRKMSGDLGVMQMIATPRNATKQALPAAAPST